MKRIKGLLLLVWICTQALGASEARRVTVAQDGTGDFRTLTEAMESVRALMDFKVTIYVKAGIYKEKLVIPAWIQHVEIVGESAETTVITHDDHAKINNMGTFRTYTVRVDADDVTFRHITIENNAPRLGQAVALHTEGNRLRFYQCRFLGNQDTVYTGGAHTSLYFEDCYIEGTTDFIFGSATAWFERCTIHSKANSYITAASTPENAAYGYIFSHCRLTADEEVTKVYLGRPWRPYAYTLFICCEMGSHIRPEGWHNWRNPANETTARYMEYGNTGPGADRTGRVAWCRKLTDKEAQAIDASDVLKMEL